jgi:hypothetical protein
MNFVLDTYHRILLVSEILMLLLIHVDIGGHPPIPNDSHAFFILEVIFLAFWVLNFQGRFEALNIIFWAFHSHTIHGVRV